MIKLLSKNHILIKSKSYFYSIKIIFLFNQNHIFIQSKSYFYSIKIIFLLNIFKLDLLLISVGSNLISDFFSNYIVLTGYKCIICSLCIFRTPKYSFIRLYYIFTCRNIPLPLWIRTMDLMNASTGRRFSRYSHWSRSNVRYWFFYISMYFIMFYTQEN